MMRPFSTTKELPTLKKRVLVFLLVSALLFVAYMALEVSSSGQAKKLYERVLSVLNSKNSEEVMEGLGLIIEDLEEGSGGGAKKGDVVIVHYTGAFESGEEFDSSRRAGRDPFQFILGAGQVIAGWDEGVVGMKIGGKRRLIVPPDLAYGPDDYGPIPGGSTLVFEVELLSIFEQ